MLQPRTATNHAVQTQASQARNLAVKALAQHLVECLRQKIPVETDQESQARIRELEGQLGDLQQQLQRQQKEAGTPAHNSSLTSGQPHRQLSFAFSPGAAQASLTKHEPAALLQPPQEGSNWLATNVPGKFQEPEIKTWIYSLTPNDRKKNELQDWLKQVETWLEAQTEDSFTTRVRRAAVIWGGSPGRSHKTQKQPLGKLIAVGSFMER